MQPGQVIIFLLPLVLALTSPPKPAFAQTDGLLPQFSGSKNTAGAKFEFDVASIRMSKPGTFLRPNMVLNGEDTPVPPGGHFIADFPLEIYIEFAYKIMPTREQEDAMLALLPRWVRTDHFVIQAEFSGHPTKDQIRLMMQSLLSERFKLAVHFETREMPIFALVVDKPGKLGSMLRPHAQGTPCDGNLAVPKDQTSPGIPPGTFIETCGRVQMLNSPNHTVLLGGRNISIDHLAGYLPDFEDIGRPIVDQTGLKGTFDFSLSWLPEQDEDSLVEKTGLEGDPGPSLVQAIKEQLGLKLKPTRAPIQVLVVDHVEPPTPN